MVVDIVDVLELELVAVVVDLVLDVERAVDIEILLATSHESVHLGERLVGELHHLMDMLILLLGEVVLLALILAGNGAGNVIVGITDTLEFGNLTQHGTDLCLGVIGEVGVAYLVEILGYF